MLALMTFIIMISHEGAYAKVCVKVGGEYGECYLADHDDYNELVKMIDSFGNASYRTAPSKIRDLILYR